jgi:LmbE family N-acetylglucosaminyl deacetylase
MNKKKAIIIFLLLGAILLAPNIIGTQEASETNNSIMYVFPHTDDEMLCPGTIITQNLSGDNVFVLCYGGNNRLPVQIKDKRETANNWFNQTYLTEYIILNLNTLNNEPYIQSQILPIIETIQPEVIVTFSPMGFNMQPHHRICSSIVSSVVENLSYNCSMWWMINTDQGVLTRDYYEHLSFPPNLVFDVSSVWCEKMASWWYYSFSARQLEMYYRDMDRLLSNDKCEYFLEVIN